MARYGMIINITKCTGCYNCQGGLYSADLYAV
ncbi:MAG: hypothetical protein H6Q39_257 [Chloroflexi bacterium]|nr:hypothetical protein [Chloroflexota bacterium]